jgi:FeS assembly SUF system protein
MQEHFMSDANQSTENPETLDTAPATPADTENEIVEALKTVYDPEIPVNIYELGLIYDIDIQAEGAVQVKMTLTSPGCPVAGSLPGEVRDKVAGVPGVTSVDVELVWDPSWNPSMMSEAARLELGMF